MKNPIRLMINNERKAECGDPFVIRFNGKYYLYPSSENEAKIHCFVSNDLINWSHAYVVCTDEIIRGAYAPEVIYNDGDFYLCTSPCGNGHYIFKSKSPLGPFIRITDNIANMIDGSFALDKNFNMKFFRANHTGIAVSDMDKEGHCSNRRNLNANMNAWTEGPSVIYKDGRYYLTYCGNHLESYGYRINYSVSKEIDKHYEIPLFNPLLISTKESYNSLGHSSTVLAPDLDGYYIVYHHLKHKYDDNNQFIGHTRDFGIDRLHFNGSMVSTTPTNFETLSPKKCDFEEDLSVSWNNFDLIGKYLLSKQKSNEIYTCEFNFKSNGIKIILAYKDENNYSYIYCKDNKIKVFKIIDGKRKLLKEEILKISFVNFHTIRIINCNMYAEILIDNVPVMKLKPFSDGKIGYYKTNGLYYTAFSNHALGSSDLNYPNIIPGILDCSHNLNEVEKKIDIEDDIYYSNLIKDEEIIFNIQAEKENIYNLAILINCNFSAKLLISSSKEQKIITIEKKDCEYLYYYKDLGFLNFSDFDTLKIKVLEGKINYKSIIVKIKENKEIIDKNYKLYLTNIEKNYQEIEFSLKSFDKGSLFGLVFNVDHYSSHPCNPDPSFVGYIVGFKNDLMVVGFANYGFTMIYDKPIKISLNKKYLLSAYIIDSKIIVYLDNKQIIETTLPNFATFGQGGVYVNEFANVQIHNYRREKHEKN